MSQPMTFLDGTVIHDTAEGIQPLSNAKVLIKGTETQERNLDITDNNGYYLISEIPLENPVTGDDRLIICFKDGYEADAVVKNLQVGINHQNFMLEPLT